MYTGIAFKISLGIALVMLALMLVAIVYTVVVYLGPFAKPSAGWTTSAASKAGAAS